MAGLDPAIHLLAERIDPRLKPGVMKRHDDSSLDTPSIIPWLP